MKVQMGILNRSLLFFSLSLGIVSCTTNQRLTQSNLAEGFNQERVHELLGLLKSQNTNLHSLLIERNGRLELELYQNGWNTSLSSGGGVVSLWSEIGPETIHDIRSGTKSIIALLAGTVLARHPEYSVHSKIRDFPELEKKTPTWGQSLELRHFLSMSSGLSWKEWGEGYLTSDESALMTVSDPLKYSLDRPLQSEPGSEFNYSGGSTYVVTRMLELIEGRSIEEIARADLFDPLGITDWLWARGSNGYFLSNGGIGLRSRDMLKIGELMLAKGKWNEKQLIPENWIEEITSPHIPVSTKYFDLDQSGTSYGYFWWNGTVDWLGKNVNWYSTVGNGGQKIFVVPRLALVVVMTAGDYGNPHIQMWETSLLKKILLAIKTE